MFSKLKVLIVDEAPVVISSVKAMLRQLGFTEENVYFSRSPKACIYMSSQDSFDIFFCSYSFGLGLNGKQILEELVHRKLLKVDGIFMLITGESTRQVAQSIIELKPDEYILKPFRPVSLKKRILNAMMRKHKLKQLYISEQSEEFEEGLAYCDELEVEHSQYYFLIQKFRANYLRNLGRFREAKEVYESVITHKPFQWATLGLANTLIALNSNTEALSLLNNLASNSNVAENSEFQMEFGNYYLCNNNVRQALFHFSLAQDLAPGNSEREIILSNLHLALAENEKALDRYRNYMRINKETFRDNAYSKINLARRILLCASHTSNENDANQLVKEVDRYLEELNSLPQEEIHCIRDQIKLLAAHRAIFNSEIKMAIDLIRETYTSTNLAHYYDWLHMCWLLDVMSQDEQLLPAIKKLRSFIVSSEPEYIRRSKEELANILENNRLERHEWITKQQEITHRYEVSRNIQGLLKTCIKIEKIYPYRRENLLKIVKLTSHALPDDMTNSQARRLLINSNKLIHELMPADKLEKLNVSVHQALLT